MGIQGPQVLRPERRDVIVVGGGPAGLLTARDLSAAGFSTIVLEEHDTIGVPVHCTGVLGMDAFDELDLPRQTILQTTHAARFISADGSSLLIEHERVRAAIIDRGRFDVSLAEGAARAGAEIHAGCRVGRIDVKEDGVTVSTARGDVHGRACVLACGANYRFNRQLGLGLPRLFVHSAQREAPFPSMDHVEVYLGRQIAAGGFGWLVPFRRGAATYARIGVMCEGQPRAAFRELAARIRGRFDAPSELDEPRVKVLPLAPVARTWSRRVLAVGDAAGLVKATTGGGIYFSLLSARIAADVLGPALRDDRLSGARLREYERRWRARLWPEIRAGLAFRAMASRLSDRTIDRVMELARVDGIVPLLKQTAEFNWHGAAARSLLRHPSFRRVVFGAIWS
ncbi:MAG TPA: NAD(P)/FAD-dependent oxidoreductase [Vicinamibacterales bacterium]|nr:NAD(P)/FAD-dependent oxidoreductase [Vicinamibacterales bacterium]